MKVEWNEKYTTISVYAILVIMVGLVFYKFIHNLSDTQKLLRSMLTTISPFLFAFLIAYFINPMVKIFEKYIFSNIRIGKKELRHSTKRGWSVLLSYLLVIGIIIVLLAYIVPQLIKSLSEIFNMLPDFIKGIITVAEDFTTEFSNRNSNYLLNLDITTVINFINATLLDTLNQFSNVLKNLVPDLINLTMNFTVAILNFILGMIIAIYLLISKEKFLASFKKIVIALFSEKSASGIFYVLKDSNQIFSKFFIGKLIDSLIIGIICFIILLVADIPYPLLISVFVGLTNMIPYFGPFIGGGIGFILVLIINPIQSLWFLLIILGLQQFDGNILGPKILGDSTGLSPFWVIFAILVAGKLFGIIGMFLGVPFFAVIKNIIDRNIEKRYENKVKFINE